MVSEMHIHNNIIEIIHNPSYMRKKQYTDWKKNFLIHKQRMVRLHTRF